MEAAATLQRRSRPGARPTNGLVCTPTSAAAESPLAFLFLTRVCHLRPLLSCPSAMLVPSAQRVLLAVPAWGRLHLSSLSHPSLTLIQGVPRGASRHGSSMEGRPGLSVCAVTSSHRLPEGSTPGLCVPPEPPGQLTQAAGYASGRLFFCRHLFSLLLALFPPAPGTFQHPTAQTEFPGGAKTWETGVLPLLLGSPADALPPLVAPGVLCPGSSRLSGLSRRLGGLTWLPRAWGCEEPDPCG